MFLPKTESDRALRAWFDARSVFLGQNNETQDVTLGIQLAAKCTTIADAVWLCSFFPNGPPRTRHDAFLALEHVQDPRAYGYICFLTEDGYFLELLQNAAHSGSVMAQCECLWRFISYYPRNEWYNNGVNALEPIALFIRAENPSIVLRAAELGLKRAMFEYAVKYMDIYDSDRYAILYQCKVGDISSSITGAVNKICASVAQQFAAGNLTLADAVYRIGSYCDENQLVIGEDDSTDICQSFYHTRTHEIHLSIRCWQMLARRLGIYKDIRILVAKYVWKSRWNQLFF